MKEKKMVENTVELAEALSNIKNTLSYQIECQTVLAKVYRAKYLALVKEGFTEEQALELSKTLFSS